MSAETPPLPPGVPATIRVDREMCQGAATCLAYHLYELDDEVKAVLLTNNNLTSDDLTNPLTTAEGEVAISSLLNPNNLTPEELQALALESAKICPFNAIIVKDNAGNQIWP